MTDPIADMFNRIRNAQAVLHSTVDIPFSNIKYEIAKILEKQGFIKKVEKKAKGPQKTLEIGLKYQKNSLAGERETKLAISDLKRVSKPGQRIYIRSQKIIPVRGGYGIAILSTSQGLMTNKEARKKKLGGEVICEIW